MPVNRIFGLDLLRSLAIILVLINHTYKYTYLRNIKLPFDVYFGFIGVELFFILSGFLIGNILITLYHKTNEINLKDIRYFWIRRWYRTLPNYYLMLIVYFLFYTYIDSHNISLNIKYIAYFLFLQNTINTHPIFFAPAWSLTIEEWFYFLFPIIIFAIQRLFKEKSKIPLYASIIVILVCLLSRIIITNIASYPWDEGYRKIMPLRLDSIAIGVIFAFYKKKYLAKWINQKMIYLVFGTLLFTLFSFIFFQSYVQNGQTNLFFKTFFFTFFSISLGFLFPYFDNLKSIKNKMLTRVVTHISLISYSMYLVHWLIIITINLKCFVIINDTLKFFIIWFLTIAISSLQYKYFEKPMTDLREKYSN
jgi:peptidoglycan/LPS O-acetylase OafA/YrhL